MPTAQDEHPVEELSSNRSHPSLSEGVGLGGSDRGEDHLRPFGLEHLVEGTGELIVAIADEVAYRCPAIITVEGEVSRLRAMEEGRDRDCRVGRGVECRDPALDVHPVALR